MFPRTNGTLVYMLAKNWVKGGHIVVQMLL